MKQQGMQLVRDVAIAEGELEAGEQHAINLLSEFFKKSVGCVDPITRIYGFFWAKPLTKRLTQT